MSINFIVNYDRYVSSGNTCKRDNGFKTYFEGNERFFFCILFSVKSTYIDLLKGGNMFPNFQHFEIRWKHLIAGVDPRFSNREGAKVDVPEHATHIPSAQREVPRKL